MNRETRLLWPSLAALVVLAAAATARAETLFVDPQTGNSTFTAVFDAALGERITASGSAVRCDVTLDEQAGTASGACAVPLQSIVVDNEPTKTEHFQQWSTNRRSPVEACTFEARFQDVRLAGPLVAEQAVRFTADVPFTVCGRSRADGAKERLEGTAVLLPAGSYGPTRTVRVRARIERFNREAYGIGPKHTEGWLAKVQKLAKVVAEEGAVELNLFAKAK